MKRVWIPVHLVNEYNDARTQGYLSDRLKRQIYWYLSQPGVDIAEAGES